MAAKKKEEPKKKTSPAGFRAIVNKRNPEIKVGDTMGKDPVYKVTSIKSVKFLSIMEIEVIGLCKEVKSNGKNN